MGAAFSPAVMAPGANPFDLSDDKSYQRWRERKLALAPTTAAELTVDIADPCRLTANERTALLDRITRANMAVYRSPVLDDDSELPRRLGAQLGMHRLDANWLAGEDGVSPIAVHAGSAPAAGERGSFVPYTDKPIGWHTDGYYHPPQRRIHGMILHCVRPALDGGSNGLLDPELAYIALRDADPAHVHALMQADVMLIPARTGEGGIARPAQGGPVFSVDAVDASLHMRYTARRRHIAWKDDAATSSAVSALTALLAGALPGIVHLRLQPGMGIVGHNVLHERSGFADDPAAPRLLYRARFLDRVSPAAEASWRNG
ncbi:MAG: TauD/TfdA family dioxygenase [Rubrivivax sp.]|nr:TauD/TfdA family dioxygenase [Rubrivivax sp.]